MVLLVLSVGDVYLYTSSLVIKGPSWSLSYVSWIYNYLCNQCVSPLMLWVLIPLSRGVLDTTLCDKFCQWLATGRLCGCLWFSPVLQFPPPDRCDVTEILLKVALNTLDNYILKHKCMAIPCLLLSYHSSSFLHMFPLKLSYYDLFHHLPDKERKHINYMLQTVNFNKHNTPFAVYSMCSYYILINCIFIFCTYMTQDHH